VVKLGMQICTVGYTWRHAEFVIKDRLIWPKITHDVIVSANRSIMHCIIQL